MLYCVKYRVKYNCNRSDVVYKIPYTRYTKHIFCRSLHMTDSCVYIVLTGLCLCGHLLIRLGVLLQILVKYFVLFLADIVVKSVEKFPFIISYAVLVLFLQTDCSELVAVDQIQLAFHLAHKSFLLRAKFVYRREKQ